MIPDRYTDADTELLAFCLLPFKLRVARELLEHIGGTQAFFAASEDSLSRAVGARSRNLFSRGSRDQALELARKEVQFAMRNGVRILRFTDSGYPRRLLECDDAPTVLFALGEADLNAPNMVGIVGTRRATVYGHTFVDTLVEDMTRDLTEKPTVISGLAYGIDVAAHRAALRMQVPTVAVLAHGLTRIYPAAHHDVARSIVRSGGALVTEYVSDAVQNKGTFLARNRIVAGLSDALVVAESDERGGAMTTARIAADYNRDVFALPGRVGDRFSRGCNMLIQHNIASLLSSADNLIEVMNWSRVPREAVQQSLFEEMNDTERMIHDLISASGHASIDSLLAATGLNMGILSATLVEMEARRLIINMPGGNYGLP